MTFLRLPAICGMLLGLAAVPAARGDWLGDANARIEAHRKANVSVRVVDGAGEPVTGAHVNVRQTEHAFRFGTAVNSDFYGSTNPTANTAIYKQKIDALFNQVVMENGHKWNPWENSGTRTRTDRTVDALLAQGKTLRGHTMVWARESSVPADVNAMIAANDAAGLAARTNAHITSIGTALAGKASQWDVVNEHWAHHAITDVINPGVAIERAPQLVEWFRTARAADPNARLFLNDYSILASGNQTNTNHQASYFNTAKHLTDSNAPLGGLGFQAHFGSANARTDGANLITILDRYAALGVDLEVTEFDMYGDGWTEATKAAYLREFMTAVFSHDAVTGFNLWGFWDGMHFANSGPIFNLDWTLKQSGQAYIDLVFGQWWTDVDGLTNAAGTYAARGFLGDYAIDVTLNGKTQTLNTTLDAAGRTLTIVLPEPTMLTLFAGAALLTRSRRRSGRAQAALTIAPELAPTSLA